MLRLLSCRCRLQRAVRQSYMATATREVVRGNATTGGGNATTPTCPVSSTSASPPRVSGGPRQLPQHPMELLSHVFQHHPSALRLHRELTVALASGDAACAADLASVLASTVQRVVAAQETTCASPSSASSGYNRMGEVPTVTGSRGDNDENSDAQTNSAEGVPPPSPDDVEEAVEKTREAVLQRVTLSPAGNSALTSQGSGVSVHKGAQALPFWRDPRCLCVTVLESAFETDVPDGEAQGSLSAAGNRAAVHEAEQMRILETYLEKEGTRWKAQKAAIAKIVLEVARALKIAPEDLQATEGVTSTSSMTHNVEERERRNSSNTGSSSGRRLNVLRHSNLVVRGEIPPAAATSATAPAEKDGVEAQLAALTERMKDLGTPLTREEVRMARYELQMSQSKMRYVVGIHTELQHALDHSESVRQALRKRVADMGPKSAGAASPPFLATGSQLFMEELIRALNEGVEAFSTKATEQKMPLSVEDVRAREVAESPVLPFTFMLKCCLWFDTTPPS
ncbi:putative mitochondrial hypothetical protein [Leptomonas pyrrhocoris]|uniref:Uncharacterized protein n=1 Tax=Leptomonas pyrrhocoris TaxID=157538 RepID=A0A0M9G148_LEPPY|nr:putative mitochondrial hypothetical protein [Leptomonas pyrrhocoris]XP_015658498.1 putative mitochondrial hypothetical protein [Leptomonas pyrrhocoris]KPA80058.1 putative mitochondrial hypothetical protein [Leptomonas pyrrhocoris]KPA80059.1 putative mitochondrial hypothetical protein [Leptomonas pyrrhocoris]|eukprot:XP_015658497.1 putative mitochondrial hypothetical protein [Leptomonas pyrrhocoris]